jgi:hypothetical protein
MLTKPTSLASHHICRPQSRRYPCKRCMCLTVLGFLTGLSSVPADLKPGLKLGESSDRLLRRAGERGFLRHERGDIFGNATPRRQWPVRGSWRAITEAGRHLLAWLEFSSSLVSEERLGNTSEDFRRFPQALRRESIPGILLCRDAAHYQYQGHWSGSFPSSTFTSTLLRS